MKAELGNLKLESRTRQAWQAGETVITHREVADVVVGPLGEVSMPRIRLGAAALKQPAGPTRG